MQAVIETSSSDHSQDDKEEVKGSEFKLDGGNPDCNLIINYIPTSYSEEDLRKVFVPYGNIVKLKIVRDYITKSSLGYGFVVFQNPADAEAATRALNGFTLDSKRLKVSIAKPPQKETEKEWTNLYVSGLPHSFTADSLTKLISQYGVVKECRLLYDPLSKSPRGVGFARLDSKENAQRAIKSLSGTIPEGGTSPLQVKFADTPAESAKRRNRSRYGPILHGGSTNNNRFSPMGRGDPYTDRLSNNDRFDTEMASSSTSRSSPSGGGGGGGLSNSFAFALHHLSPSSAGSSSMSSQHSQLLSPSSMASPSSLGSSSMGSPSSLSASAQHLFLNNNNSPSNHYSDGGGFNHLLSGYDSAGYNLLNPSSLNGYHGYDLPSPTVGGGSGGSGKHHHHAHSSSAASVTGGGGGGAASSQSFQGICLFVYHLPPDTTEAALWQLFSAHGTVCSTKVMKDLRTNQSKGFGFVNMMNESDAHAALQALNGYQLGSKHLKVSIKTQK